MEMPGRQHFPSLATKVFLFRSAYGRHKQAVTLKQGRVINYGIPTGGIE
jgi:hypothetical protein